MDALKAMTSKTLSGIGKAVLVVALLFMVGIVFEAQQVEAQYAGNTCKIFSPRLGTKSNPICGIGLSTGCKGENLYCVAPLC